MVPHPETPYVCMLNHADVQVLKVVSSQGAPLADCTGKLTDREGLLPALLDGTSFAITYRPMNRNISPSVTHIRVCNLGGIVPAARR